MSHNASLRNLTLTVFVLSAPLCVWSASGADPWIRHFRAGVLIGANLDAEFSQSGTFSTSPKPAGVYDDGFVLGDSTGNAGGVTSNWGYDSPAQYDAAVETLTFSRSSGFTVNDDSTANSDPQFGFDLAYGGTLKRIGKTWISWEVGFSLLPISIKGDSSAETLLTKQTFTYSTAGLIVPLAPYSGSASGGPVLSTNLVGSAQSTSSGTLSASREIETLLYNLRLGPHFHWDLNQNWSIEAMGGFALGLVDGEYSYDERLSSPTGVSSASGDLQQTSWLYGGYAGVLTQVHVERNAYFYGSAQFMSLGHVEFSGGGREATLRLDQGLYFSVGFTWLF
ncbi:MAG: hypothetical protein MUE94_00870 [Verrucomicrobia bacterium]|jgi:hypothetical protein|nr:hypothetical protein [Verrucomicrobiota bacterium]